jgi:hypothetical protein
VSRRKRPAGESRAAGDRDTAAGGGGPARRRGSLATDVAVLIAVFALTTAIAELAGAANLGVAIGVGQVAFTIALVVLLLRA